ncbi:hypothetical protein PoB_005188200 [Plakobranchus ocellatus]|uniref:Uncharacterized protein n=1 Tax=Plakobranchus ocellatus TaxID=259542 RepID=A0AAV4C1A8_9GAST|nr:hypothetical protein PoB_005188200 [Plakobranchus ocellatus]
MGGHCPHQWSSYGQARPEGKVSSSLARLTINTLSNGHLLLGMNAGMKNGGDGASREAEATQGQESQEKCENEEYSVSTRGQKLENPASLHCFFSPPRQIYCIDQSGHPDPLFRMKLRSH